MKTKLLLFSLLCIGLLSCETDNKRENENGSSDKKGSQFDYEKVKYPEGAIKGVFSVSDTKKVAFSKGNLQYQASTNTWRFAEHQYDMVGMGYGQVDPEIYGCLVGGTVPNSDNREISPTYSGWIDLFGWGTGNNPTNVSEDYKDYSTFVDWGVNKISNGGNVANVWFTLSYNEWDYLLTKRTNSGSKAGLACVNGVGGLVLLPDNWILPSGAHFTPDFPQDDAYYLRPSEFVSTYTVLEWSVMEKAGAVFLPESAIRKGFNIYYKRYYYDEDNWWSFGDGNYWSSTEYDRVNVANMCFDNWESVINYWDVRYFGFSVRLCSEL